MMGCDILQIRQENEPIKLMKKGLQLLGLLPS